MHWPFRYLFFLFWKTRKLSISLLIPYIALLFVTTVITRTARSTAQYEFTPFWTLEAYFSGTSYDVIQQVAANIIMFFPVGILFPPLVKKKTILYGFLISCFIELCQLILHRGLCEVDDIICNTIGVVLGYAIYILIVKIKGKTRGTGLNV